MSSGNGLTAIAKVPADESFKLSQALGFDTASLWDRTGVLEKSGENVQASAIRQTNQGQESGRADRRRYTPASLVDALHRMCAFREKGDTQGMGEFLGRSGHANNSSSVARRSSRQRNPPGWRQGKAAHARSSQPKRWTGRGSQGTETVLGPPLASRGEKRY